MDSSSLRQQGTPSYRFGELAPFLAPLESTSVVLAGEERRDSLRQMELRHAVAIWPHGFEWQGTGATRRADLGELGLLTARLDDRARPETIEGRLADGEVRFALTAIRWEQPREPEGSARLVTTTFVERGVALWDETVEPVQRDFRCVDRFFLPPDRRDYVAERADLGRPEPATMPRGTWRRTALAPGADWRVARARGGARARGDRGARSEGPGPRALDHLRALGLRAPRRRPAAARGGPGRPTGRLADPAGAPGRPGHAPVGAPGPIRDPASPTADRGRGHGSPAHGGPGSRLFGPLRGRLQRREEHDVVPKVARSPSTHGDGAPAEQEPGGAPRPPHRYLWAELMRRSFGLDVLLCRKCRTHRRLVALVTERPVIVAILTHLGLDADPPPIHPARAPPR